MVKYQELVQGLSPWCLPKEHLKNDLLILLVCDLRGHLFEDDLHILDFLSLLSLRMFHCLFYLLAYCIPFN